MDSSICCGLSAWQSPKLFFFHHGRPCGYYGRVDRRRPALIINAARVHGNQRRIISGQTIAADTFRPKLLDFLRKIYETEAPSSKMGKCGLVYKSAGSYARKIG